VIETNTNPKLNTMYKPITIENEKTRLEIHALLATGRSKSFEAEMLQKLMDNETTLIKDIFKMILGNDNPSTEEWQKCSIGIVENNPEMKYLYFNTKRVAIVERVTKIKNTDVEIEYQYRIL
jgi:hypothetical protein